MKQQFEVIAIDKKTTQQTMTLKVNHSGGCHECKVSSSCGTGILANYFDKYSTFKKTLKTGVLPGDFVTLEISSSVLFFRGFVLYILPLLVLFVSAAVAQIFFPAQEIIQIALGISGFFATLLGINLLWKF